MSRQTPFSLPMPSRIPTTRKPHALCSEMLAEFSGKMLACNVQMPFCSDSRTSVSSKAVANPLTMARRHDVDADFGNSGVHRAGRDCAQSCPTDDRIAVNGDQPR